MDCASGEDAGAVPSRVEKESVGAAKVCDQSRAIAGGHTGNRDAFTPRLLHHCILLCKASHVFAREWILKIRTSYFCCSYFYCTVIFVTIFF